MVLKALSRNLITALACAFATAPASAQSDYPRRSITLIVPFAAGGPTDVIARIVSEHMSRTLGQQVVVENVVGAGGTTATTRAARASPDGYTIEMGHMGTHAASVALYRKLAYKPEVDFDPIGMSAGTPIVIVAKRDFPPKDLREFRSYLKTNEAKLNMAHAGVGSVSHATGLLLNSITGVNPTQIPFNGTGPAMNAMVAGQVDYMTDQIGNVVAQVQGSTIKAYAIATAERNPVLPDLPTTKEAGMPEFEVSAWNALFAPKGTPKPILDKLTNALDKALDDQTTRERLLEIGNVVPGKSGRGPRALSALVKSEIGRWSKVIKAAGVQID
jgi:tripartite-type tricarboxylate transporter receptor subunit TctC